MTRRVASGACGGGRGVGTLRRPPAGRAPRWGLARVLLAVVLGSVAGGCAHALPADPPAPEPDPAPAPAPPALNHVYVVLDAPTFAALRDSGAVERTLGPLDAGLPDHPPPGPDADRVFLRGRHTYLEFFGPDNRFDEPVGKVGIAMGFDDAPPLARLERAWRRTYGDDIRRTEVSWRRSTPPVPWYDAVQRDATAAGAELVLWAMVYRPEFVRWRAGEGERPSGTARAEALAPRWHDGQGFVDVVEVSVDVSAALHDALVEQLTLAGMAATRTDSGTRLDGEDWSLTLGRADGGARGLTHLRLRTASATPAAPPFAVGRSCLARAANGTAVWRFDLPGARASHEAAAPPVDGSGRMKQDSGETPCATRN